MGEKDQKDLVKKMLKNKEFISSCKLEEGVHIEHEMIKRLITKDYDSQPSIKEIQEEYLPIWKKQIETDKLVILSNQNEGSFQANVKLIVPKIEFETTHGG